ncbi:hypothetical protein MJG53_014207 [Ovis ammon polii x Ovis aries]|uniref:Uncharacterized protein n=1 Tax=Ovis ammon polii x Ovis aries TaxID=2918886 RepID=A0ACB9UFW6_9CETA|nr:hypothetical protein MJG53_014207 [Ovis ammon polii x Ovis aries]
MSTLKPENHDHVKEGKPWLDMGPAQGQRSDKERKEVVKKSGVERYVGGDQGFPDVGVRMNGLIRYLRKSKDFLLTLEIWEKVVWVEHDFELPKERESLYRILRQGTEISHAAKYGQNKKGRKDKGIGSYLKTLLFMKAITGHECSPDIFGGAAVGLQVTCVSLCNTLDWAMALAFSVKIWYSQQWYVFVSYDKQQMDDTYLIWLQVVKILEKHDPLKNTQAKYGSIPPDEASAVQNYVEHMLFLLIEEQARDAAMGPILEFVVSENIMEKLFLWSLRREFTDETKMEQLKMYEMLITQSHQPLLHHKPILKPLMMLLSSCSGTTTPTVEGKLVVLLNQLCSILAKDPSILELFFHTSEDQGAANFLIFSLLIPFIHREGTVGQQARDALLFIMSLSAENTVVAHHIVENTYFCPVLATGLSGLYSSLPTKLEEKGEGWHCLLRDDWLLLPPLVQFMNSLEFCNAVIQVAHPLIRNQLVNYIYNGFLVPVLAPALHKVSNYQPWQGEKQEAAYREHFDGMLTLVGLVVRCEEHLSMATLQLGCDAGGRSCSEL